MLTNAEIKLKHIQFAREWLCADVDNMAEAFRERIDIYFDRFKRSIREPDEINLGCYTYDMLVDYAKGVTDVKTRLDDYIEHVRLNEPEYRSIAQAEARQELCGE